MGLIFRHRLLHLFCWRTRRRFSRAFYKRTGSQILEDDADEGDGWEDRIFRTNQALKDTDLAGSGVSGVEWA